MFLLYGKREGLTGQTLSYAFTNNVRVSRPAELDPTAI